MGEDIVYSSQECGAAKAQLADELVGILRFDGDALYLLSIKEMATVIDCMKIHPISTLLGGDSGMLFPAVKMSSEQSIALHGYLTEGLEKGIDQYRKAAGL